MDPMSQQHMEMYNERMVLDLIILIWWENCSYQNEPTAHGDV